MEVNLTREEDFTKEDVLHQLIHEVNRRLHTYALLLDGLTISGSVRDINMAANILSNIKRKTRHYTKNPDMFYNENK